MITSKLNPTGWSIRRQSAAYRRRAAAVSWGGCV